MASNCFPRFSDGNVEIRLSENDEKYVLHAWQLTLHSTFFHASLSERWNGGRQATNGDGGKTEWTYELRFEKGSAVGTLLQKADVSSSQNTDTEFIKGSRDKPPANADQATIELHARRVNSLKAHQSVLGAVYHMPPTLSHESFDSAKDSIRLLADVAKIYGCEHIVKLSIENHLCLYQNDIQKECSTDPVAMLELAMAVKSAWVFMEAATNLLGRNQLSYDSAIPQLADMGIAELFAGKRAQFKDQLKECEWQLFSIMPPISDPWCSFVATGFFRQWLADNLTSGFGSGLSEAYATIYHDIKQGFYPTQGARLRDHVMFLTGGGPDVVSRVARELSNLLYHTLQYIDPITKDNTKRQDQSKDPGRDLTFMKIGDDELPWVKK